MTQDPKPLAERTTDEELKRIREWCSSREADKPWYGEFGDSPKMLTKCDFMVSLIDEVLAARAGVPQGKMVPDEPTGEMMDAARHLFQWLANSRPTEQILLFHCNRRRIAPPPECRDVDHVPPKRMMAYWVYKAMLSAAPPTIQGEPDLSQEPAA